MKKKSSPKMKMKKINKLLDHLETRIPFSDIINQDVSQATVGWHIEHSLLTINRMVDFIVQSNPKDYQWKFSLIRALVLTTKRIPRGRANAPEAVQPEGNIVKDNLKNHLVNTRSKIEKLESLSKNNYLEHPMFGKLSLRQSKIFIQIHTHHHLKIINDIITN